jgi:para-nitrobenzyl esterase
MESGICALNPTLAEAAVQGADFAEALGCDSGDDADVRDCLRSASVAEVMEALPAKEGFFFGEGVSWGPVVDGELLEVQPVFGYLGGNYARVPVILGTNADEGTLFIFLAGGSLTAEQYEAYVGEAFGTDAEAVLAEYPLEDYASPADAAAELLADAYFVCPARLMARTTTAFEVPTYLYHFTHVVEGGLFGDLGAFHLSEVPFVFQSGGLGFIFDEAEQALSDEMQGYWTRFAADGDPNGEGAVEWVPYSLATDNHLELATEIHAGSELRKARCDFWDDLRM